MKTSYQYIHFKILEEKPATQIWEIYNNKTNFPLGVIKWACSWRRYCFFPYTPTVFSDGCLYDIIDFIKQLMDARKK